MVSLMQQAVNRPERWWLVALALRFQLLDGPSCQTSVRVVRFGVFFFCVRISPPASCAPPPPHARRSVQRAQEKFAQAQQYYMTAQIMRQADNSGLIHGAPQSGPLPAAAVGGTGAVAPPSPSKPVSGLLQTDGSDVTQCTTRHDHSLSAVAQSYMSTQNTSGTTPTRPATPGATAAMLASRPFFPAGDTAPHSAVLDRLCLKWP